MPVDNILLAEKAKEKVDKRNDNEQQKKREEALENKSLKIKDRISEIKILF